MLETRIHQKLSANLALKPATLAVFIQISALFSLLLLLWIFYWVATSLFKHAPDLPIYVFVLLQAVVATVYSYWAGMAKWWRWIHFFFPVTVWLMSGLQLPNSVYLVGFVITLALYWTTFRTQVPFYPSRPAIWRQVAAVIPQGRPLRVVDIGSGLGDLSMYLAQLRPDCLIEGVEIAPLPWIISKLRAKLKQSRAVFRMEDYHALNFADYDVIFAYLSPAAMPALWEKAKSEMCVGSLLISYEFDIEGVLPTEVIESDGRAEKLFVWRYGDA